jgi:hypothetical protein
MKGMKMRDGANAPQVAMGPGVEMINPMPMDRTGEPGIGMDPAYVGAGHKVLTYRDLVAATPIPTPRPRARDRGASDRRDGSLHVVDGWQDHAASA